MYSIKKPLLAILFFILLSLSLRAQSKADTSEFPYYIQMMQDTSANYFDVQRAFNKYYAKHAPEKGDEGEKDNDEDESFSLYKRWEYIMRSKIKPDGTRIPAGQVMHEYLKYINNPAARAFSTGVYSANPSGNWSSLGPSYLPISRTGYAISGMGRVGAIAFDPFDTSKYYIGAPAGGLWVTTNSGTLWTPLTDGLPTLGVSAIAIDKNADSTIYIGTGDRDHYDAPGLGVMKSTDGGKTWININSTMGDVTVAKLLINPVNSNVILAATSGGIYRSANGGSNWTLTSPNANFYKDIVFKPHHPNVVYAESYSKFYRSTDSGKSFTRISTIDSNYRGVIGVTPADTDYVYFILTGAFGFTGCYLSADGGTSFSLQANYPNVMDWSDNGSGTGGQAFYDLCISVDTADKTHLYVGGINLFQSTNSGVDWSVAAHWTGSFDTTIPVIHADQHVMAINPLNNRLYEGNDGGVYYTANGSASWKCVSGNITITQIYKVAQSAVRPDLLMVGCQDNATSILDRGQWFNVIGGDGMDVAMDTQDTMYNYGSYVDGILYQSADAGNTYNVIGGYGINGIADSGEWVTPYALSKKDNGTMFAGYNNLYKCSSLKSSINWFAVSNNLAGTNSAFINAFDQSNSDTNVLYMCRSDNTLFMTSNALTGSPTWVNLTPFLPTGAYIQDVKVHPKFANMVYIIQNQNVYVSTDSGVKWRNITGTLPNVSMNCLFFDSNANSGIYVGTDAGIYYRDSTMTDWVAYNASLPVAAEVTDMKIYYDTTNSSNNMLKACTFGRGTWQTPLYSMAPVGFTSTDTAVCMHSSISFTDTSKGSPTSWHWAISRPGARAFINGTSGASQNPVVRFDSVGYYSIKLTATNAAYSNFNTYYRYIHVIADPGIIGGQQASVCMGDSLRLSSYPASSYSWTSNPSGLVSSMSNPTVSPTITTTYYLKSSNSCGNVSDSQVVSIGSFPNAHWTANVSYEEVSLTPDVTKAKSYRWYFGNGDSSLADSPVYFYKAIGTYIINLFVTNTGGCTSEYDSAITISSISGISKTASDVFNLSIFPNPFNSTLYLSYLLPQNQGVQLTITDITGKQIATLANENQTSGQHIYTLDATKYNIPAGIYFLRMVAGNDAVVEKIVRIK